jgi:glutamate transport system substrate-binding protein
MTMKLRTLAVGVLVGGLALAACGREGTPEGEPMVTQTTAINVTVAGSPTFDKMKQRGKVVVGVKEDQPGLGLKDPTTGQFSGFDVEIARLIAAKLGFDSQTKIDYKPIPSASREQAIINGDVDYYVGTYSITDKRKEQISFAGPYFVAGQDLLVRKDDTSITGPDTLKGKKVCSVTGSTPIQRVRDQKLTDDANVVEFKTYSECVTKLDQGEVDAVTTDDAILKGYAAQEPDKFKVVGKTFSTEKYGVGLAKDDNALRNKINDLLQEAIDSGEWTTIYDATLGKSGSPATPPQLERY